MACSLSSTEASAKEMILQAGQDKGFWKSVCEPGRVTFLTVDLNRREIQEITLFKNSKTTLFPLKMLLCKRGLKVVKVKV